MSTIEERVLVQEHLAHEKIPEKIDQLAEDELKQKIKSLLVEENAVIVAHYYTDKVIQELAEETGGCISDSLEMARFGSIHKAETLLVAGVRFMGETAKILSPEKRVIMPSLEATCSLDLGCPVDEFSDFARMPKPILKKIDLNKINFRAEGFPAELVDKEPEEKGYEI